MDSSKLSRRTHTANLQRDVWSGTLETDYDIDCSWDMVPQKLQRERVLLKVLRALRQSTDVKGDLSPEIRSCMECVCVSHARGPSAFTPDVTSACLHYFRRHSRHNNIFQSADREGDSRTDSKIPPLHRFSKSEHVYMTTYKRNSGAAL